MAKLSSDGKYVTVEYKDTLSSIAKEFLGDASKYKQLAAINDISNPNYIAVGQDIYLAKTTSTTIVTNKKASGNKVTIKQFGLQSNSENTLFVTWAWSKSNTENYKVMWYYGTGDGVWFVGSDGTTEYKQSTYSIPSNAKNVKVKIKPIAKKHTVNNKEVSYWTAEWSAEKKYSVTKPPATPPVPTVDITEKNKLVASVDNLESDAKYIEFQIVKNNKTIVKTENPVSRGVTSTTTGKNTVTVDLNLDYTVYQVQVSKSYASFQRAVDAGGEYKVRCRAVNGKLFSEWSEYSANVASYPSTPKSIVELRALSSTSVYISWNKVSTAESYTIQWTEKKSYFDSSPNNVSSATVESTVSHHEATGLESGKEYFFRVKATNKKGDSGWTDVKSVIVGKKPSAPTTWSSVNTAMYGENVYLYWVHNSEDGSSQVTAELEITLFDFAPAIIEVPNTATGDNKDKTSSWKFETTKFLSKYYEGIDMTDYSFKWRVRTKGIHASYSPWSISREVDVYSKPTLDFWIANPEDYTDEINTIESFPIQMHGVTEPLSQIPMEYHIEIVSKSAYETEDETGSVKYVSVGEVLYSKHGIYGDTEMFEETIEAGDVILDDGKSYRANCTVSMGSGLIATDHVDFKVSWSEIADYVPNARISIDTEKLTASINPYCEKVSLVYRPVEYDNGIYHMTGDVIEGNVYGEIIDGFLTEYGEQIYNGVDEDGKEFLYGIEEVREEVHDVILSVYRREVDGTLTAIETDIESDQVFVTDPHPSLDYARYRIVATNVGTGKIDFYDVPAIPIGEHAVIIQWSESYTSFEGFNEDALEDDIYKSSMIKIPYNIDVSESNDPDVSLVEYIGRKHPVGYYGTQLGEKETWSVEIPKNDIETLYDLRRLKNWMGDVYVREPSGKGYWANIQVSFSIKHKETTIPVTFSITRVEGGK